MPARLPPCAAEQHCRRRDAGACSCMQLHAGATPPCCRCARRVQAAPMQRRCHQCARRHRPPEHAPPSQALRLCTVAALHASNPLNNCTNLPSGYTRITANHCNDTRWAPPTPRPCAAPACWQLAQRAARKLPCARGRPASLRPKRCPSPHPWPRSLSIDYPLWLSEQLLYASRWLDTRLPWWFSMARQARHRLGSGQQLRACGRCFCLQATGRHAAPAGPAPARSSSAWLL